LPQKIAMLFTSFAVVYVEQALNEMTDHSRQD